jgi:predicted MFS family arabinose efflux permease
MRPLSLVYTISNVMQRLGYFFSSLYLPSYAASIRLSTIKGALLPALMSISQVCGQFTFGYLSDHRISLNLLIVTSLLAASTAVLTLWGLAHTLATLLIFSLVHGFFGAGYVAMESSFKTGFGSIPSRQILCNHFN